MEMNGPELLLVASAGFLTASAAVCLVRCRGHLRKVLAVWTGVMLGALALLIPGGMLLGRLGLSWRGWVVCLLYHGALAGGVGVLLSTVRCLGQLLGERLKWLRRCWTGAAAAAGLWVLLMAALMGVATIVLAAEERVVTWEDRQVVEVDRSWLDPCYVYYDDRGPLVRGTDSLAVSKRPLQGL